MISSSVFAQPYGTWTYESPPAYLSDATWLDNARLGTLRLSGCAASLVSADGLVVTSASCVRAAVARILGDSTAIAGYYADSLRDEYSLAPLEARQVASLVDITGEDEEDYLEDYTLEYHIVPRDDSTRIWLYALRPFRDIRLVLLPSASVADFGQESGVFPRHSLDFALLRLYAPDGTPYITENYYAWSDRSPAAGEMLYATSIVRQIPQLTAATVDVYVYNGTITPPFTTLFGLFDLHFAHGATGAWALPARWLARQDALDLSVPLNFAVAGECPQLGAAFLNQDLEIRGMAFEQISTGDHQPRCVSVAAAGILAAVRGIFGADRIADELEFQQIGQSGE